jgi:transcriptional regulator with XRE-family HTH domain
MDIFDEVTRVSHFGDLIKRLRREQGLTLDQVAGKIGSHKGYVSGIENDKVRPPSVKFIKKFARLFRQDPRFLVRLAWVDKAPELIRHEAEEFLRWHQTGMLPSQRRLDGAPSLSDQAAVQEADSRAVRTPG